MSTDQEVFDVLSIAADSAVVEGSCPVKLVQQQRLGSATGSR